VADQPEVGSIYVDGPCSAKIVSIIVYCDNTVTDSNGKFASAVFLTTD